MNTTNVRPFRSSTARSPMRALPSTVLAAVASFLLSGLIFCSSQAIAASNSDDFNDNSKNTAKWGTDRTFGRAALTERNQRLEYTCSSPTVKDETARPWVLTRFPYNADWEIQVDTFNSTVPNQTFQVNSVGIDILSPASDQIYLELYSSALGSLPSRTGFASECLTGDTTIGYVDQAGGSGVTNGAVRMAFNSATKVITVFYDLENSDGYQWVQFGSFGLAGAGGADGNADWHLNDTNQFTAFISGFSDFMTVTSGQMYVDNFMETGGVPPSGEPLPEIPVGTFQFQFPTNNPLLTRIASIAGNYQGVSPTAFQRNYSVDVAQDESGKLAMMGTMDGILDKDGNSQISAGSGTVKTVNGEPTVKIKGKFTGTRDGVGASFSGNSTAPVEVVDVGAGTNGLIGTGSYSSKVGGVPFSGKNLPLAVAAPPGAVDNLQQDWSLQLDISRKLIGTKERTVASAQLVLPDGDTIAYRERVVRYSATRGYSLSFTRGTNLTLNPAKIDKKTSIAIKRLSFTRQGADWQPTNGVVTYQFLGQKGTGNLMDFLTP